MRRRIQIMSILLCGIILFSMAYPAKVVSGPYFNSAHGNTSYGVNRSATVFVGYTKGHCGHCHEQHASIDNEEPAPAGGKPSPFALFSDNFVSQSEDFCLNCHRSTGSVQVSFDRTNYDYSYWFGGDHVNHTIPNNIYDAFNPPSSGCCNASMHNLQDILDFVKQKWPETFGNESNPCNACHNPHLSQRGYPVVRPTDRNHIWGDDPNEKMSYYASTHGGQYQAPCWYGSSATYEPDGSTLTDGSNVPDYITFCTDCHNATNTIYSSNQLTSTAALSDCGTCVPRNLRQIDWANSSRTYPQAGDYHGSITRCFDVDGTQGGQWRTCGCFDENFFGGSGNCPADRSYKDPGCTKTDGSCCCLLSSTGKYVPLPRWWGAIKPPYETANSADSVNFILNCTDCHEPHGSALPYLLRKTVNGKYETNPGIGGPQPSWDQLFCTTCHYHFQDKTVSTYNPEFGVTVTGNGWHCGGPASCLNCHSHNAYAKCWACWYCAAPPVGGTPGHTF